MKKIKTTLFTVMLLAIIAISESFAVTVSGALSGNGSYTTLAAAFSAINSGSQTGKNILILIDNNTTEPSTGAILNSGTWSSLKIQPSGSFTRTISGNINGPMLLLNGADNVTIDGLNSGGNKLIISNTSISSIASTICFQADATYNVVTRSNILGSCKDGFSDGGNILFYNYSTVSGNDNNTISFCNIGPAGNNLPNVCINSRGTSSPSVLNNSGDTIRNCKIFDYFQDGAQSAGIHLYDGTSDFVIKDNKFYQTSTRTQTYGLQHSAIWISNYYGSNFTISGNIIGYSSDEETGVYSFSGTSNSQFIPISVSAGDVSPTSIQGNVITSISVSGDIGSSTYPTFAGIYSDKGLLNIGNLSGNVIGSMTDTGNIRITPIGNRTVSIYGIYYSGWQPISINNNNIGGITSDSTISVVRYYGIRTFDEYTLFFINIINNVIGGETANSINIKTDIETRGISNEARLSTAIIAGNIIRNIKSSSTAQLVGIIPGGQYTLVDSNNIYNLKNVNNTFPSQVNGIYALGGNDTLSRNFIHNLEGGGNNSTINGIRIQGGFRTIRNNMISIGLDTSGNSLNYGASINGIIETGTVTNNIYFNSIYIGGNPTSGTGITFAFNSSSTLNTRIYRNNIFCNSRSNNGSTGKHYAVKIGGTSNLTIDNNLYLANGNGGVFGSYNNVDRSNLSAWQSAVGQDASSFYGNPQFLNPNGSSSLANLHIDPNVVTLVEGNGYNIASVTNDYDGQTRSSLTPVDIGADAGNFTKPAITLNLKMFIQGFYNVATDLQKSDTVKVYLRNSSAPYAIIDSSKSVVSDSGKSVCMFSNAASGTYFIEVKHRNSIETWSSTGIAMTQGTTVDYDFTNAASGAFGNNLIQVDNSPVKFAVYNGNVNQDNLIDLSDVLQVYNDASLFKTGYIVTDVNGNNITDLSDVLITSNNSNNFVSVVRP